MPTDDGVRYEWDEVNSDETRRRRGFGFEIMAGFAWDYALCVEIQPHADEDREKWLGPIGDRLFVTVITERNGRVRVVSLRRATQNEIAYWRRNVRP